ncbi:hypothetical protein Aperf_G00000022991 [Anoplocephala perfoliata]
MVLDRCHAFKLGQHTRAPLTVKPPNSLPSTDGIRTADAVFLAPASATSSSLSPPYWPTRIPSYNWLSRGQAPQWNQLELQNCCERGGRPSLHVGGPGASTLAATFHRFLPQIWITLADNLCCCEVPGPTPRDILTVEEVLKHERAVQRAAESQRYLRRTQRILRIQHLQWLSHREFLASFGKPPKTQRKRRQREIREEISTYPPSAPISTATSSAEFSNSPASEILLNPSETPRTTGLNVSTATSSAFTEKLQESAVLTVHRLAIRSKTILISGGVMKARLRYLIQLHQTIEGRHKLSVEVRLHPQYPPIYTGTVEDVCTYWPANAPGSQCSLKKPRFYQKGRICLCHMPPGIYHQRLRINFGDVFEGAQISQFLINILFSGQHLNLYVTVTLTSAANTTVACSRSKIPVSFSSF